LQVGQSTQSFGWCAAALARQLTCAQPPLLPARQHAQPVESSTWLLGVVVAFRELTDPADEAVDILIDVLGFRLHASCHPLPLLHGWQHNSQPPTLASCLRPK
jgi:hypothetical protein